MKTSTVQLLNAYRAAWGLLSLRQKQQVYKALESLPNWKYCKDLIVEDSRTKHGK